MDLFNSTVDSDLGVEKDEMPILNRDLLYIIAEKMFAPKKCPCTFSYSKEDWDALCHFMLINQDCAKALISQFSKIKYYGIVENVVATHFISSQDHINTKNIFVRRYTVPAVFIAFLIQNGKFRPKEVYLSDFQKFQEKNPAEMLNLYGFAGAFLSILGFNDLAENIIDYPYMELDKIVSEDVNWFSKLDTYLMLNSKRMELFSKVSRCLNFKRQIWKKITSPKVEQIDMSFCLNFPAEYSKHPKGDFYAYHWFELIVYLLKSCPNLKSLDIILNDTYPNHNLGADKHSKWILRVLSSFKKLVIPKILVLQSLPFINVQIKAVIPDLWTYTFGDHPIFRFGDVCDDEEIETGNLHREISYSRIRNHNDQINLVSILKLDLNIVFDEQIV